MNENDDATLDLIEGVDELNENISELITVLNKLFPYLTYYLESGENIEYDA
tara:strand:- start:205 stop:357 length:153 start_codon:yes stop_codon:yes gene_type:complete